MHKLKELLIDQMKYESDLLARFEKEISELPAGCLSLKIIRGKEYIYYQRTVNRSSARKLLSFKRKEDQVLIGALRKKFFIRKSLERLRGNARIFAEMIKQFYPYDPESIREEMKPIYKEIQLTEFKSEKDQEIERWHAAEAEGGIYYAEGLKHIAVSGIRVRSKSEAIIADLLDSHNIQYKYEEPLFIGREKYIPDFTIINKSFPDKIYWEHFGMTYDPVYRENMEIKLASYGKGGIIPWKNLIVTFESEDGGIDVARINEIIKKMVL